MSLSARARARARDPGRWPFFSFVVLRQRELHGQVTTCAPWVSPIRNPSQGHASLSLFFRVGCRHGLVISFESDTKKKVKTVTGQVPRRALAHPPIGTAVRTRLFFFACSHLYEHEYCSAVLDRPRTHLSFCHRRRHSHAGPTPFSARLHVESVARRASYVQASPHANSPSDVLRPPKAVASGSSSSGSSSSSSSLVRVW